jgi:hypothetical protein
MKYFKEAVYFKKALLEIESVWNCVNNERRELLLLKGYKDALSFANIVDQLLVTEFQLEDESGSNVDDLQGYMLVLACGERDSRSDFTGSVNQNSLNREWL